ncbi:ABC transporter substrate-binding protein [Nocardioides sp. GXZ039]|uniref:ABC transporter substrate-binding protein n=1 Tax=Nocardioides sp. GXZ039 TaxID=3136018 RepID=UPI0030F372C0
MKRIVLLVCLALAGASMASCSESDAKSSGGDTPTVKVVLGPASATLPVYRALDQDYFTDAGINVEVTTLQSGPDIINAVMGGSGDIGFTGTEAALIAVGKGLPLRVVAGASLTDQTEEASTVGVMVAGDSSISSFADLAGKTVAVNALGVGMEPAIRASVDAAGGDGEAVNTTVVPIPNMIAALEAKRVDAIAVLEPFLTLGAQSGLKTIGDPLLATQPDASQTLYVATSEYAEQNAKALESFKEALGRATEDLAADADLAPDLAAKHLELDPALAQAVRFPRFDAAITSQQLAVVGDFALQVGNIEQPLDYDSLIWASS